MGVGFRVVLVIRRPRQEAKAGGLELLGWPGLHDVLILPSLPQYFSSIWKESTPFTIRLGFVLRQGLYVALTVVELFM